MKYSGFMSIYVVAIYQYFSGYKNFTVDAENKDDAIKKAKEKVKKYGNGNFNLDDAKVVKKCK